MSQPLGNPLLKCNNTFGKPLQVIHKCGQLSDIFNSVYIPTPNPNKKTTTSSVARLAGLVKTPSRSKAFRSQLLGKPLRYNTFGKPIFLRGTILIRTHHAPKNPYIPPFLHTI